MRLKTILDLGRKHNLPLPAWDVEGLRPCSSDRTSTRDYGFYRQV